MDSHYSLEIGFMQRGLTQITPVSMSLPGCVPGSRISYTGSSVVGASIPHAGQVIVSAGCRCPTFIFKV